MNTKEFSNEFDVLFNNIVSNQAVGLDEYEKSVLLTKAQQEIIKNYINPLGNKYRQGAEDTSIRSSDLSSLITVASFKSSEGELFTSKYLSQSNTSCKFPNDIVSILHENAEVYNIITDTKYIVNVLPISHEEYIRTRSRPYKYPKKNTIWRLLNLNENLNRSNKDIASLITNIEETVTDYNIRYIRLPSPIILADIDVSIQGKNTVTECELPETLHQEILQRAVELAKVSYLGDVKGTIEIGQRSE